MTSLAAVLEQPADSAAALSAVTGPAIAARRNPGAAINPEMARDLTLAATLLLSMAFVTGAYAIAVAALPSIAAASGQVATPIATAAMALAVLTALTRPSFSVFASESDAKRLAVIASMAACPGAAGLAATGAASITWALYLIAATTAICAVAGNRLALQRLARRFGADKLAQRRVAVFGAGPIADEIAAQASEPASPIRLAGVFDDRRDPSRRNGMQALISGTGDDLATLVQDGYIDDVVVALPEWAKSRVDTVVERLSHSAVNVYSPVTLVEAAGLPVEDGSVTRMGRLVLICLYRRPIDGWGACGKALFDRAVAGLALILLLPLFAAVGLAIKLETRGPVFFRQTRHGISGRPIKVWKFRSMRTQDDGPVVKQAVKGDPRITHVGAFLRKTSLDELPQLINVVLGEMSLVGPRPHAVAHNQHYEKIVEGYNRRQRVKPGITGLAQISGFRGETQDPALMQARIDHDLRYIRGWSPALDLKILFLTPTLGLVHPNAY